MKWGGLGNDREKIHLTTLLRPAMSKDKSKMEQNPRGREKEEKWGPGEEICRCKIFKDAWKGRRNQEKETPKIQKQKQCPSGKSREGG